MIVHSAKTDANQELQSFTFVQVPRALYADIKGMGHSQGSANYQPLINSLMLSFRSPT